MIKIDMNFSTFAKLLLFIFVPVFIIVIVTWYLLKKYYENEKSKKNKGDRKYVYNMNFYSLVVSITVSCILLIINIWYVVKFESIIDRNNIKTIDEIVLRIFNLSPIIPGVCISYYATKLIVLIKSKKKYMNKDKIEEIEII